VRTQERSDEDLMRAHVEFTLLTAGVPWEVLKEADEVRLLEYYAIALTERELEREAVLGG
jgi:hypothetical protein